MDKQPNWRYTFYENKRTITRAYFIERLTQKELDGLVELAEASRKGKITYKEEKINE